MTHNEEGLPRDFQPEDLARKFLAVVDSSTEVRLAYGSAIRSRGVSSRRHNKGMVVVCTHSPAIFRCVKILIGGS